MSVTSLIFKSNQKNIVQRQYIKVFFFSCLCSDRYWTVPSEDYKSEDIYCGQRDSSDAALESTTLHIRSSEHRSPSPKELYISESQNEAYYELDSNKSIPTEPQLICTELHGPSSVGGRGQESGFTESDGDVRQCLSPGDMVELQVSLSEQTLHEVGCTSLGCALGIQGELSNRESIKMTRTTTLPHSVPSSVREPLSQRGVVLSSASMLGQVEVILEQPGAPEGRSVLSVGGPKVSGSVGSQSEEEGGGHWAGVPGSFTVSFGIPPEEATPAEEQDSDSERDRDKPNKHRAKHASKYPQTVCVETEELFFKREFAS